MSMTMADFIVSTQKAFWLVENSLKWMAASFDLPRVLGGPSPLLTILS